MTDLIPVKRKFDLPALATPDSIAELVRAILSLKAVVRKMVLTAEPPGVDVDMLVPNREPPFGEVEVEGPTDIWQLIQTVELEEAALTDDSTLRKEPTVLLAALLMRAARQKLAGVAFATGSATAVMRWLGLVEEPPLAVLWNIPLLQTSSIAADKLVLLCAKSSRVSPLRATVGYLIQMEDYDA
jgi:hypothetical protein